jgi:hypothetical protein
MSRRRLPPHVDKFLDDFWPDNNTQRQSSSEDEQTQKQSSDEDETQRQSSSEEEQTPKNTPSRKESVTPSPSKKHVSPKERYLRQKWLQKRHKEAMKLNRNSKPRSPSPSPPRVPNLSDKPVEGLGSGKGWENAMKRAKDIERQYKNNKDYGKGLGFGPGDESDDELDDEAEDSDDDDDMEDRGNPFRRGTEEYKAYAKKLRESRRKKRKGKNENYPALAMRMRKQEALRKEQQALRRKELARKKRLEEGITNLRISNALNRKRMNNMKKRLKNIQSGMKKDLKKKKPPKKTKRWYIDDSQDSQEETESDLQHKINIKF